MTYQICPGLVSEYLCLLASGGITLIGPVFFHNNISKTRRVVFIQLTFNLLCSIYFRRLAAVTDLIQMNRLLVIVS